MNYWMQKGREAYDKGESRVCDYRGSAGADFRRGYDERKREVEQRDNQQIA